MEEVFMQEVSAWCNLQHSNIAEFIGAINKNNMSKIKMKCEKGATLPINGCCIVVEYVPEIQLLSNTSFSSPSSTMLLSSAPFSPATVSSIVFPVEQVSLGGSMMRTK
ncbi:hypothetical protein KY290_024394 [Solanum tuberosum]|uniref:Serine-threonine/tyrosine-protein kinase catalytic domain-containing protein n=1 Tax=Solanum tuberosum TaxID=4113 RepID=A0ABQ7UQK1_SOLTU|nr:hypothetical protein KY290_024394 [Solanum tuberosum]